MARVSSWTRICCSCKCHVRLSSGSRGVQAQKAAPNWITLANLIKSCSAEQWEQILNLLQKLPRDQKNVVPYTVAVTKLTRAEFWQMALGLHLDMRLQRVADVGSYAALLTACRSGTAWQTSLVLLQEAYSVQLQPDSDTTCSSAVISALTRATQVSRALMARHLASETPNFNALIMSLRHVQASWVHAFHVLEDMKRRQISSDMGTLKAALSICGKHKPELVPKISRQLQIQPDILAVNMIVGSMEKCHSWQAALRELRLVGQTRLRAELTTYNTVISACSKASRWSWALHLVDVMVSSALEPDEITSGSLITACSSQGRWLLALQLLHLHSLRHGRPNLIAAHSAITACEKAGRWMWSLHLFSDALSSRLTPDLSLLGAVLSSFEKGQQWARALQLLSQINKESFSPDIALITSATSACAKAHCWEMTLLLTYEAGLLACRLCMTMTIARSNKAKL